MGTSVDRIANRQDQVRSVIRATLQGIKYLKEHEAEAAEIAVRRLEVSPADAGRILEFLRPSWVDNGKLTDAEIQAVIEERKGTLNLTADFTPATSDFSFTLDLVNGTATATVTSGVLVGDTITAAPATAETTPATCPNGMTGLKRLDVPQTTVTFSH